MADVLCKVVNKEGTSGTVHATFPVNLDRALFTPGGQPPGEATWTVHPDEPALAALAKPYLGGRREVQLWEGGECRWWGVPLTYDLETMEAIRYRARDLKYHFARRNFGPIQNNYLEPNADFESGLTGWTAVGATATVDSGWKAMGTQSAKLVQATAGTDTYLRRRVTVTTTTDPVFYSAKALLHIANAGWVGPALDERGLYLELQVTPGGALVSGVAPVWDIINNSLDRDSFQALWQEKGIIVPAGMTATIEIRLYAPGGTVWWDHTALRTEESIGSDLAGDPADQVFTNVVNYLNDPDWGWSELNMPVTVVGGSAPEISRHHQFSSNGNGLDAMNQYVAEGLLEWDIFWSADGSARGVKAWTAGRGSVIPPGTFTISFPGNVVDVRWGADGSGVVTKARFTGRGSQSTQDVFEAVDTSAMDGLTLASVDSAPSDAATDALYRMAVEKVNRNRQPKAATGYRLPASEVVGTFWLGDTVRVVSDWGPAIQTNEDKRIERLEWDGSTYLVDWEDAA